MPFDLPANLVQRWQSSKSVAKHIAQGSAERVNDQQKARRLQGPSQDVCCGRQVTVRQQIISGPINTWTTKPLRGRPNEDRRAFGHDLFSSSDSPVARSPDSPAVFPRFPPENTQLLTTDCLILQIHLDACARIQPSSSQRTLAISH